MTADQRKILEKFATGHGPVSKAIKAALHDLDHARSLVPPPGPCGVCGGSGGVVTAEDVYVRCDACDGGGRARQ